MALGSEIGITPSIACSKDALAFYNSLRQCQDNYISVQLNKALDALMDTIRLYGPHKVFSSYNGGKDADVIMHLLRAVFAQYSHEKGVIFQPELVYFVDEDEFDDVTSHITQSTKDFDLHITTYRCGIVSGLRQHIELRGSDAHCAFVLGTRKGDPNCGDQGVFAPSSSWMPLPFMRVNPILNWDYGHVWHFLRTFNLPYCDLYNHGYTSLGKRSQTRPNPSLLRQLPEGGYWPAYMLSDWSLERAGRGPIPPTTASAASSSSIGDSAGSPRRASFSSPSLEAPALSAALLIVGDEILSGFTVESNLRVASHALASVGIPLRRVSIVSDSVDEIVEEVRRLSQAHDFVLTSGGIGPTHDDVTLHAIAKVLGQEIVEHIEMMEYLKSVQREQQQSSSSSCEDELDVGMKRLALLPSETRLRFPPPISAGSSASSSVPPSLSRKASWPVLQCGKIFVLPGVPQFFAAKMQLLTQHFLPRRPVPHVCKVVLDIEERSLLSSLDRIVLQCPRVKIGSYPFVDHPEFKTIITAEGMQVADVEEAVQSLIDVLNPAVVLRVERGPHHLSSLEAGDPGLQGRA